jgi:glycosyltransferase involved in cell wall biosynthesis
MSQFEEGITVIIPAYNSHNTICSALDSVLAQKTPANQIIVVDDGSSDNTIDAVQGAYSSEQVQIISQQNQGPSAARNTGIKAAEYAWIAFLDADDLWVDLYKLRDQLALAAARDTVLVDSFTEVLSTDGSIRTRAFIKSDKGANNFLRFNSINGTSSVIARTESVLKAGMFNENIKFGEDRLLWANLALLGKVRTVEKVQTRKINTQVNLTHNAHVYFHHNMQAIMQIFTLCGLSATGRNKLWLVNTKPYFKAALRDYAFCRQLYQFAKAHFSRIHFVVFLIPLTAASAVKSLLTNNKASDKGAS